MDVSPPLMAEVGGVEEVVVEEGPDVVGDVREEGGVEVRRRKRRRSKASDDGISWEHGSGRTRVKRGERRGMGWMMVVGGVLFVGITVLVVKVLSGGDDPVVVAKPVVGNQQKPVLAKDERRGDGELLAEMEPLCRKFLNTEGRHWCWWSRWCGRIMRPKVGGLIRRGWRRSTLRRGWFTGMGLCG